MADPDQGEPSHDLVLRKTAVVVIGHQAQGRGGGGANCWRENLSRSSLLGLGGPKIGRRGDAAQSAEEIDDAGGCSSFAGPC
jgi:hypothetical protein